MPTNNFKLFDENKANLLSDTEYANATQRLNGVQTGVASSQLNNKFAYQVSLVAYAIAQIMNQNGLDASDTLSVSAFVGNLGGSLLQKVADRASSAEAVAGVLENKYISPATMKAAALLLSGGVMAGTLDMNNNQIINLPTPTSNSEPATKEYVDREQSFNVLEVYNSYLPKNVNGEQRFELSNLTKVDLMKAAFMEFKFSNISQLNRISLSSSSRYTAGDLQIYASKDAIGVGTSSVILPFTKTLVESSTRVSRLLEFDSDRSTYLVLMNNNKFYTYLKIDIAITSNVTFEAYIYVPKV